MAQTTRGAWQRRSTVAATCVVACVLGLTDTGGVRGAAVRRESRSTTAGTADYAGQLFVIGDRQLVAHNTSGEVVPNILARSLLTQPRVTAQVMDSLREFLRGTVPEPKLDTDTARQWVQQSQAMFGRLPAVDDAGRVSFPVMRDLNLMRSGETAAKGPLQHRIGRYADPEWRLDTVRALPWRDGIDHSQPAELLAVAAEQGVRANSWDDLLIEAVRRGWRGPERFRREVDEAIAVTPRLWGDDPEVLRSGVPELLGTALSRDQLMALEASGWTVKVDHSDFGPRGLGIDDSTRELVIDPDKSFLLNSSPLGWMSQQGRQEVDLLQGYFDYAVVQPKRNALGLRLFRSGGGLPGQVHAQVLEVFSRNLKEPQIRELVDQGLQIRVTPTGTEPYRVQGRTIELSAQAWGRAVGSLDPSAREQAARWARGLYREVTDETAKTPAVRDLRSELALRSDAVDLRSMVQDPSLPDMMRSEVTRELLAIQRTLGMERDAPARKLLQLRASVRDAIETKGHTPLAALADEELAEYAGRLDVVDDPELAQWIAQAVRSRGVLEVQRGADLFRSELAKALTFSSDMLSPAAPSLRRMPDITEVVPRDGLKSWEQSARSAPRDVEHLRNMLSEVPEPYLGSLASEGVQIRIDPKAGGSSVEGFHIERGTSSGASASSRQVLVHPQWLDALAEAQPKERQALLSAWVQGIDARLSSQP